MTAYAYDQADRLVTAGNNSFVFDNNGNLVEKTDSSGTIAYSYNGENHLVQVNLPNGDSVTFAYD
ncbi:MAG: RHS repeat protein, partial [Maritimibacter sp.]